MAERIRSVVVTVEVDTNKDTYRKRLELHEDESLEAFQQRVREAIERRVRLS